MAAKIRLNLPSSLWTARDSARLGLNTVAAIKLRTSKGLDANDKRFKRYSIKPLYVAFKGARLKPKGGRLSRTGRSIYYKRGYAQYKAESRRVGRGSSALVDLVASGALMNNLVLKEATKHRFIIGLTANVAHYGYAVNADREYLGLSPRDVNVLVSAVQAELTKKIRGSR